MSAPVGPVNIDAGEKGLRLPASALDHDGFREWVKSDDFPEGVRATWVGGEVFLEMSPEALYTHNQVKGSVFATVRWWVERKNLGEVFADGVLLSNKPAGISCEPDLIFALWKSMRSNKLRAVAKKGHTDDAKEFEGTPDLVVEVISDSSVQKDNVKLRRAYAQAGIPEYWLIDARGQDLKFEILSLRGGVYRSASTKGASQRSAVLKGAFALARTRNRLGHWSYKLTAR